jgi:hypothetical protein
VRIVEPDGFARRDGAESRELCVAIIDWEAGTSLCDSPRESGCEFGFEVISPDDSRELTLFSDDLFRLLTASSLILGSCRRGGEGGE